MNDRREKKREKERRVCGEEGRIQWVFIEVIKRF
jgi:hypothetical protein